MEEIVKDELTFKVLADRPEVGRASADEVSQAINDLLKVQDKVRIIFASAPSQNEFLAELLLRPIDWERVVAFHMDEYIGLSPEAPQSFARFLVDRLFSKVPMGEIHCINGAAPNPEAECSRYAELLTLNPIDIVILGIGENTHLAFNDPHVAFFDDPLVVKVVSLDEENRNQQVRDGAFPTLAEVPTHAITITIPELLKPKYAFAIVPGKFKALAIYHTAYAEISERYPSTALRRKKGSVVFVDRESAEKL